MRVASKHEKDKQHMERNRELLTRLMACTDDDQKQKYLRELRSDDSFVAFYTDNPIELKELCMYELEALDI